MNEIFHAASNFVIGFFLFLLRSPASAAWAQSFAIVTTGIIAFFAAKKAYDGAVVQAKAAQTNAETTLLIHESEKNDRRDGTRAAFLSEISAMMLSLQILYDRSIEPPNAYRSWDKHEDTIEFGTVLNVTKTNFPIFEHDPYAVAALGSESATRIIMFYDEYLAAVQGARSVTSPTGDTNREGFEYIRKHTERLLQEGADILKPLLLALPPETREQWDKWRNRVNVPILRTISFE